MDGHDDMIAGIFSGPDTPVWKTEKNYLKLSCQYQLPFLEMLSSSSHPIEQGSYLRKVKVVLSSAPGQNSSNLGSAAWD